MHPAIANRLPEARAACLEIESFTNGRTIDDMWRDRSIQLSLHKLIEIVGEALGQARRIDPGVAEVIPDLFRFVAVRNQITHGYASVDYAIIWEIATRRIPGLVEALDRALALLASEPPPDEKGRG